MKFKDITVTIDDGYTTWQYKIRPPENYNKSLDDMAESLRKCVGGEILESECAIEEE